jgi:hypothetical protein
LIRWFALFVQFFPLSLLILLLFHFLVLSFLLNSEFTNINFKTAINLDQKKKKKEGFGGMTVVNRGISLSFLFV